MNYWELRKALPNEKNKETIEDFLLNMKLGNKSQGSIILYRRFLEHFFMDMDEPFSSLSPDTIHQWFLTKQAKVKDATFRLRMSMLSSFYTFCVQEGLVEKSPIKSRWFPRLPQAVPKYLDKEEIAKTRKQSEMIKLRNQVIVELMLSSGCRIAELVQLNREDVDLENRSARVMGKGKKIRHIHFTEKCAVLLEKHMASIQNHSSPALFISTRKERLGVRIIGRMVANLGKEAGLSSPLYPHRLRHTFATELLSKGAELSFISEELGHSDLTTTQIYARLPNKEIISLYRKYMG